MHEGVVPPPTPVGTKEIKLLTDEENSIRLASFFVVMKLFKRFENDKDIKSLSIENASQTCQRMEDDSSFCAYTTEWIQSIDRGGLFSVSDSTFNMFKAEHLACLNQQCNKDEEIHTIIADETVQLKWKPVRVNVIDE